MNIFLHELKRRRKSLLIWSVCIVVFMLMSMAKYDALATDAEAMRQIMSKFPQTIQAVFGMTGLDITTVGGYFGICFLYIELLLAVHGGLLGVSVLAEEEQDKTTEFLYVKPISRPSVITQKLAAGLVNIVSVWLVTVVSAWASVAAFADMKGFEQPFALFMVAALLIQLVFYFVGSASVGLLKNSSMPGRLVASVVFLSYLVYVFSKLAGAFDSLKYVSVFRYFDAVDVLKNGALNSSYVLLCAAVVLVCAVSTYLLYSRRDLEV